MAEVDRRELEARAAPRTCAGVGGMWQLLRRHARILQPEPERSRAQRQTYLADARIVRVQDRGRALWEAAQRALDGLRDLLQLAIPVELVAKKVQDDGGFRLDLVDGLRQARLVDLEHAPVRAQPAVRARAPERRRGRAEDQVGAGTV